MDGPGELSTLPSVGFAPLGAVSASSASDANASPQQQDTSQTELLVIDSASLSDEEPPLQGERCTLLIYTDVPQEEDAEPEVLSCSYGSRELRGVSRRTSFAIGNFGHDAFGESTDASGDGCCLRAVVCHLPSINRTTV
ncbi:hypothetical protein N9L68_00670 [bacterium]|nr:hypothetical protein [bacterium]